MFLFLSKETKILIFSRNLQMFQLHRILFLYTLHDTPKHSRPQVLSRQCGTAIRKAIFRIYIAF